ncbi:hypothetical protein ACJZ2D_007651 [Fusarium nematophilum]
MGGIAKLFEELTSDEYLAGLWKSRFADMLAWRVHSPEPLRSLEYRAPSWSWASVDSPVRPHGVSALAESLVEMVSAVVETRTSDRMSTILGASAVLKARVIPAVCQLFSMSFATVLAPAGEFRVHIYPDTTHVELIAGRECSYMPLKFDYVYASTGETSPYVVCLMLERDAQSTELLDRYRRLGHFVLDKQGGHDIELLCLGADTREIEIV